MSNSSLRSVPTETFENEPNRGTPGTMWRRLLSAAATPASYQFSSGGLAAAHNFFRSGAQDIDADEANGLFVLPFGPKRANQIVLSFYGKGSALDTFGLRLWGYRYDYNAGGFTRRIRADMQLVLGSVTCPTEVAEGTGKLWVDSTSSLTVYSPVSVPYVSSAPGGGIPLNLAIDPLGDWFLVGELAQNGGAATLFNGRHYLL